MESEAKLAKSAKGKEKQLISLSGEMPNKLLYGGNGEKVSRKGHYLEIGNSVSCSRNHERKGDKDVRISWFRSYCIYTLFIF